MVEKESLIIHYSKNCKLDIEKHKKQLSKNNTINQHERRSNKQELEPLVY